MKFNYKLQITIIYLIIISQNESHKLPIDLITKTWENTRASPPVYDISQISATPKAERQMQNREISKRFNLPPPHSVNSIQEIPETPKGKTLHDHFGTYPYDEEQGPSTIKPRFNSPNALQTEPHMMSFATGELFNIDDYKSISRNYIPYQNEDKKSILRKMLTNTEQPCVIELQPYQNLCSAHTNCEPCIASNGCGWCVSTQSCVPGDVIAPSCRNYCFDRLNSWAHSSGRLCPGGPTSGLLTNIAKESKHRLIKPEIREHLGANGPWIDEIKEDMYTPSHARVVSGDFSNLATSARDIITPEQRGSTKDTQIPNTWNPGIIKNINYIVLSSVQQMNLNLPIKGNLKVNGNTNIPA